MCKYYISMPAALGFMHRFSSLPTLAAGRGEEYVAVVYYVTIVIWILIMIIILTVPYVLSNSNTNAMVRLRRVQVMCTDFNDNRLSSMHCRETMQTRLDTSLELLN